MKNNLSHIVIENVSKKYISNQVESLSNLNLKITARSKFGILGPNGAGKTTLISIMCDLISPSSGAVSYVLEDQSNLEGIALKKRIGFVPQEYAFYPELSPLQNLEYFGALYGFKKKELKTRIPVVLELLGLTTVAKKKIHTFSGGMKRRVNLAIGIIHEPTILFLDEPTVGVDVQSKFAIISLLEEINKNGTTIIYTSHHLSEAENFCDSIALIDKGKVMCMDQTKELLIKYNVANLEALFIQLTGQELRD